MKYEQNPRELKKILDGVLEMGEFKPREGKTYCNLAIRKIVVLLGLDLFYDEDKKRVMLANEMFDYIHSAKSQFGRVDTGEDAAKLATSGILVVAAQKMGGHGHIAAVYPGKSMENSASWGKLVPMLANIGKKNGVMRASLCFKDEPEYWCVLPF